MRNSFVDCIIYLLGTKCNSINDQNINCLTALIYEIVNYLYSSSDVTDLLYLFFILIYLFSCFLL